MNFSILVVGLLGLPLVAAVGGFIFPRAAKALGVASATLTLFLALFLGHWVSAPFALSVPWLHVGALSVGFGLLFTPLASMMALVVGLVAFAVNIFSLHYMKDDVAQPRYYAAISLFTFSMLGVTLANNLLTLFAFWEMVGFCSYLLIGHYSTAVAARAANKAFLVNRLGDIFFILGVVLAFINLGTGDLLALSYRFAELPAALQNTIAILLLAGVVAKSAQLPAHLWLPDAMAGPTPISALIHAATMVAAGVYLLCRVSFIFTPVLPIIEFLGVATALCAALWAFGQTDIKRVLAYSTISQLGFMVAGFGLGSPSAAFFHLTTHAFFKALLFLSAGAILTACHHEQDSLKMGGLYKKIPFTFGVFLIGSLALAGFPMTAGFFSKDTILGLAHEHSPLVYGLLMFTSLLTALYMGRLIGLTFFGKARSPAAEHAQEGPLHYQGPLLLLAIGALVAGAVSIYPAFSGRLFASLPAEVPGVLMIGWGFLVTLLGAGVTYLYSRGGVEPLERAGVFYSAIKNGFYVDLLWNALGEKMVYTVGRAFAFVDEKLLGGLFSGGLGASVVAAGGFAKDSYRRLLTSTLYWILFGALLMVLFFTL